MSRPALQARAFRSRCQRHRKPESQRDVNLIEVMADERWERLVDRSVRYGLGLPGNGSAFPLCTLGAGSSDRLRNDYCETLGAQENQRLAI